MTAPAILHDRDGRPWFVPLPPTEWRPFTGPGEDTPAEVRLERRQDGETILARPQWRWADGRTREGYWMPESMFRAIRESAA